MRILLKRPGLAWKVEEVNNSTESLQNIIDGYLEVVAHDGNGNVLICDENGRLIPEKRKNNVYGADIRGTVFICGLCDGQFSDMQIPINFHHVIQEMINSGVLNEYR